MQSVDALKLVNVTRRFGKTTALAGWAAASDHPVAWLEASEW